MGAVLVSWEEETNYVHSVNAAAHALDNSVLPLYHTTPIEVGRQVHVSGSPFDPHAENGLANYIRYKTYLDFATFVKQLDAHMNEWDNRLNWLPSVTEAVRIKMMASATADYDRALQDWRVTLVRDGIAVNAPDVNAPIKRPPGIVDIVAKSAETLPDAPGSLGISIKTVAVVALVGVAAFYFLGAKKMLLPSG
jgi:hypothetical protein